MKKDTSAITIKAFVEKLTAGGGENPPPADCVEYGLKRGWLEMQDAARGEEILLRKHAASLVHNFLRFELKESDEIDGSPAYKLQDLFDCHICAGHIIQIYVKGIMKGDTLPDGRLVFNGDKAVSTDEAEEIVARIFQKDARVPQKPEESVSGQKKTPEMLSPVQAVKLMQQSENVLLVDVRTKREFEQEHWKGAVNVPLLSIIKNPFVFSEKRDATLLLYCEEGYQSMAAAKCLMETGYKKVAYFAWKA